MKKLFVALLAFGSFSAFGAGAALNCNSITTAGNYPIASNPVSSTNCPTITSNGTMTVSRPNNGVYPTVVMQDLITSAGQLFTRYRNESATWSSWVTGGAVAVTGGTNNAQSGLQFRYGSAATGVIAPAAVQSITVTYGTACTTAAYTINVSVLEASVGVPVGVKIKTQSASGFVAEVENLLASGASTAAGTLYYTVNCH